MRTGLTELADAAVGSLFDELIMVTGLNSQNLDGTMQSLKAFAEVVKQEKIPRIRTIPVFSPLPNAEISKVRERLGIAHQQMKELAAELRNTSPIHLILPKFDHENDRIPRFHTIHYCDYLALDDQDVLLKMYPETLTAKEITEFAKLLHLNRKTAFPGTVSGIFYINTLTGMRRLKRHIRKP